jgi:hypothetical protein
MKSTKPKKLFITDKLMKKLNQVIVHRIKKNLFGAKTIIDTDEEIAAGIYVYAVEEFGKLLLLKGCSKEGDKYVIEYKEKFLSHNYKFKLALDFLQKNNKDECIVLNNEGSFTAKSFYWNDFTLGLLPKTEARLGVFYSDFDYDTTANEITDIKSIPSIDNIRLSKAIEGLQTVISETEVEI